MLGATFDNDIINSVLLYPNIYSTGVTMPKNVDIGKNNSFTPSHPPTTTSHHMYDTVGLVGENFYCIFVRIIKIRNFENMHFYAFIDAITPS